MPEEHCTFRKHNATVKDQQALCKKLFLYKVRYASH